MTVLYSAFLLLSRNGEERKAAEKEDRESKKYTITNT